MVLIDVMVPSAHLVLPTKLSDSYDHLNNLKALDERRYDAENKWLSY